MLSTACYKRQVVTITKNSSPCITEMYPELPDATFYECEGWEACLDLYGAQAVMGYFLDSLMWMRQAWIACGPEEIEDIKEN